MKENHMANKTNRKTEPVSTHVEIMPESDEVIVLTGDDGKDVSFYQIACVEYGSEFFAVLQAAEELEGVADDEALIFKIVEDEEDDLFYPVEDDGEEYVILKATVDGEDMLFETVDDDDEFEKVEDYFNDLLFSEVDYDED